MLIRYFHIENKRAEAFSKCCCMCEANETKAENNREERNTSERKHIRINKQGSVNTISWLISYSCVWFFFSSFFNIIFPHYIEMTFVFTFEYDCLMFGKLVVVFLFFCVKAHVIQLKAFDRRANEHGTSQLQSRHPQFLRFDAWFFSSDMCDLHWDMDNWCFAIHFHATQTETHQFRIYKHLKGKWVRSINWTPSVQSN